MKGNRGKSKRVATASKQTATPATEKSFYEGNPRYVCSDPKADITAVVAYLRKHANNEAMIAFVRDYPNMTFTVQSSTDSTPQPIAISTISESA